MKQAVDVGPFGELADARVLADLAAVAEGRGWDGFFVWDHVAYRAPVRAVADPWISLAAIACATSRVRLGPMVTPLSRRRVHKVARETATLDRLSAGRLTLGIGLGSPRNGEFEPFGEVSDPRQRARLLDQGLDELTRYWAGQFEPVPVQQPRIPVWVAAEWPHRRPVRRAARWDGLFPTDLPGPEALAELVGEVREERPDGDPFDFIVGIAPGDDPKPWAQAGATWLVTDLGIQPTLTRVLQTIEAGPWNPGSLCTTSSGRTASDTAPAGAGSAAWLPAGAPGFDEVLAVIGAERCDEANGRELGVALDGGIRGDLPGERPCARPTLKPARLSALRRPSPPTAAAHPRAGTPR